MYRQKKKIYTCDLSGRASASQTYIFSCVKILVTSTYILSMQFPYIITYSMTLYGAASELENFRLFTFKNSYFFQYLLVLLIPFCRYKLHVCRLIHVPTNFLMTKLRKSIMGGGGFAPAPPPPPQATLVVWCKLVKDVKTGLLEI